MRLTAALLIAFALGTTSPARADDAALYQPKIVPNCTVFNIPGVGIVCGFADIEDWKKVLAADAELVHARARLKKEPKRCSNLAAQVDLLQGQIGINAQAIELLTARNEDLVQQLVALDRKYQLERVKPRLGSPIAWSIAAVATSLLVGVVVLD